MHWSAKYIVISFIIIFSSCAQKVYFFEAQKLKSSETTQLDEKKIFVNSHFAGDALDYVVFELEVDNQSVDSILISYRNVTLEVYDDTNSRPKIFDAIPKDVLIRQLEDRYKVLEREKKNRDVANTINIGISLIAVAFGGIEAVDAVIYSTDSAFIMLEDSRSHKLLKGSIEEQIEYVNEWVLDEVSLLSKQSNSWDIIFPRYLFDADATFVLQFEDMNYTQDYDLDIIEEKVRR